MTLYKEAFLNLLDRFSRAVKQGEYKKLEYNLWRDLYGLAKDGCQADIERGWEDEIVLVVWLNDSFKPRHYEFEVIDRSFGEYLKEELRIANLVEKAKVECKVATFDESNANNSVLNNTLSSKGLAFGKYEYQFDPAWTNLETISYDSYIANKADIASLNQVEKRVEKLEMKNIIFEERKEKEKMKGFNFEFGSCEHDNVRMSVYGLAVKNATGEWVSYDKTSGDIMNVDILNFEGGKYMYKMPMAIKDIARGDVIIHGRKPMFVTGVADGKVSAIDPFAGEEKIILLTRSPFGFDFVTKVVCLFDGMVGGANESNPFGNMLPLMLLGDKGDLDPAMLMLAMGGGKMDMSNPMMMYMLMKDGGNSDMLPFLLMSGFGKTCHCECDKEG